MKHTPDWQSKSEYEPEIIIGNADTGYGDDGTEVRYTPICEVSESEDFAANLALILAAPKLLAALRGVMEMISTGVLVRETAADGTPGWAMRQLPLVMALKCADEAIVKAEPK